MHPRRGPLRHATYAGAGVDTDAMSAGLKGLLTWVRDTEGFRVGSGAPVGPPGFFANVLRLTDTFSLAISTDGVGSKSAVAQLAGSYESIGWDCIAVNVNDVLCVGAEPVAVVDYISLQYPHEGLLAALGKGLHDGAERAGIAVVGGELSQHPDTLAGPRDGYAFDISGTCVGLLEGRDAITGGKVAPGDVLIAMPSDGIHANGLTLARQVLLREGAEAVDRWLDSCGRTVGEELLRPTHIYVPEVLALLRAEAGIELKGLAHISGDGLLNLTRLQADVGYRIDRLPPTPPIFDVIRQEGNVAVTEMYRVFNMGVGFCVIVGPSSVDAALRAVGEAGGEASVIGEVVAGPRRVEVPALGIVGTGGTFSQTG